MITTHVTTPTRPTCQTSQQTGDVPRSMLDMQPHWPLAMSCTGIHEDMREGLH